MTHTLLMTFGLALLTPAAAYAETSIGELPDRGQTVEQVRYRISPDRTISLDVTFHEPEFPADTVPASSHRFFISGLTLDPTSGEITYSSPDQAPLLCATSKSHRFLGFPQWKTTPTGACGITRLAREKDGTIRIFFGSAIQLK